MRFSGWRGQVPAAGTLVNTPQQVVVMEGQNIAIEPALPNEVYVPVYDWHDAYREPGSVVVSAGPEHRAVVQP